MAAVCLSSEYLFILILETLNVEVKPEQEPATPGQDTGDVWRRVGGDEKWQETVQAEIRTRISGLQVLLFVLTLFSLLRMGMKKGAPSWGNPKEEFEISSGCREWSPLS